jgi:tRNA threonylcarbamoyladenosine biosynthesis protein TsaB
LSILLLNSGDSNAFAALLSNNERTISYASGFPDGSDHRSKKPDKLIQSVKSLSDHSDFKKIEAIAVTIGPGSFTGIRVGLSIAKGMAFALGVKLIPINNFNLAINRLEKIEPDVEYCVLIPAKLPEYYYSIITEGDQASQGCIYIENLEEIIKKSAVIVGDFYNESELKHHYFKYINLKNSKSELDSMCELAERLFGAGNLLDAVKTKPLYLKDFTMKKPARN